MSKLKKEMIKLLKEDKEFRYTVAGLIGLDEILNRLNKHDEKFIEILKRLDKHEEELVKLREDMVKGFQRHDEEIARLREDMNKGFEIVERHISALGARWGIMAEDAFREGIKGLLEKEFNIKIEKWKDYDNEGVVYGYPSPIEIDIALKDEKIILIEITSHARNSDISIFKKKCIFYEKKTGKIPSRLIIVTPYANENAINTSKKLNIEIYTRV